MHANSVKQHIKSFRQPCSARVQCSFSCLLTKKKKEKTGRWLRKILDSLLSYQASFICIFTHTHMLYPALKAVMLWSMSRVLV